MAEEHDEMPDAAIARIAESLQVLPAVDPSAIARVLVAAAAAERDDVRRARIRSRRVRGVVVGALAASLALGIGLSRRSTSDDASVAAHAARPSATRPADASSPRATLASSSGEPAAVTVQLVMRAPAAHRMSVVGDFTGWDDRRVPMQRDAASGLWSATVAVRPGRHVYAFVADDSVWMRDPAAPVATDPDFGRPGSLLLVGRP